MTFINKTHVFVFLSVNMDLASLSADVKRGQVDRHLEFLDDKIKK